MRPCLVLVVFGVALQLARGSETDPDTIAKFLAGLPVLGTSLENRSRERAWATHAAELDRLWTRFEQEQVAKIELWGPQWLGDSYTDSAPVFYMFSGPDFIYPDLLFPNAQSYILCGREPDGQIPDIASLSAAALPKSLANLRRSLDSVLNWSFFITKKMKSDLSHSELKGTLPVLYVFLA